MALRNWLLKLLAEFDCLIIKYDEIVYKVENETDYKAHFGNWDGNISFTGNGAGNTEKSYFFGWTYGIGVVINFDKRLDTYKVGYNTYYRIFLQYNKDWEEVLLKTHPGLFDDCTGCKCHNDLMVTGSCRGKVSGIEIFKSSK